MKERKQNAYNRFYRNGQHGTSTCRGNDKRRKNHRRRDICFCAASGTPARKCKTNRHTPVSVCSGILLVEEKNSFSEEQAAFAEELFGSMGKYMKLPTSSIGAANALAGCGPAFVAMVIEALGDAAVKHGLTREQAYALASGVMEGTAKLQQESGMHPGVLKDQVCSPGGVTIKGVAALEENGMRNAFMKAVDATF